MRCSEPGGRVAVAIVASRAPGRCAWVVRRHYAHCHDHKSETHREAAPLRQAFTATVPLPPRHRKTPTGESIGRRYRFVSLTRNPEVPARQEAVRKQERF